MSMDYSDGATPLEHDEMEGLLMNLQQGSTIDWFTSTRLLMETAGMQD